MGDVKKSIMAVELFCGGGGLTKGLSEAGIKVIKGIDADNTARYTYERNNPGAEFIESDIRKLSVKELMRGIDRKKNDFMLAGCAPCQPFSRHTFEPKRDKRKSLMQCFTHFVEKIIPDYLLVENVPGFKKDTNPYYASFIRTIKEHGYHFDEGVINAAAYGVPQSRRRYVLLGSQKHPIKIPFGAYGTKVRFKTVRDAIKKYPKVKAGVLHAKIPNHQASNLTDVNLQRIKLIPNNGGSRSDLPKSMQLRCHKKHSGHTDVYGRMCWDRPSPTLTCKCISLSNGRFGHPIQNRAITVREAAALQTFPDNYVFYSTKTNNAVHIGNAVPVLLAKKLASVFMTNIKDV